MARSRALRARGLAAHSASSGRRARRSGAERRRDLLEPGVRVGPALDEIEHLAHRRRDLPVGRQRGDERAKREALALLAERPRKTTKATALGYIGGRVAACLIRDGLAVRKPEMWGGVHVPNAYEIHITIAGRVALEDES